MGTYLSKLTSQSACRIYAHALYVSTYFLSRSTCNSVTYISAHLRTSSFHIVVIPNAPLNSRTYVLTRSSRHTHSPTHPSIQSFLAEGYVRHTYHSLLLLIVMARTNEEGMVKGMLSHQKHGGESTTAQQVYIYIHEKYGIVRILTISKLIRYPSTIPSLRSYLLPMHLTLNMGVKRQK